ncbi:MAG TPA: hypothetical protein VE077_03710 [Candidatus Methylomirabilis sp.]|nr:hypothetical protein [Candidatus Methylomirabilis sp.]
MNCLTKARFASTTFKQLCHLLILASLPFSAVAQELLLPSEVPAVNNLLDSQADAKSLKCEVHPRAPSLDFNFHFEAGFVLIVRPPRITAGQEFVAYLRVTPQGASPTLLEAAFQFPSSHSNAPPDGDTGGLRNAELSISGAFDLGEGRYTVELLLLDAPHSCFKRWTVQTGKYNSRVISLALKPHTVAPLAPQSWDGNLHPNGVRLTVLLDAAPIDAFSPRLHAWDRALLLQALASLLTQIPCQSVDLVAFNLDQQRQVFRRQAFDSAAFDELANVLKNTEQDTIPYQALRRGSARRFLQQLVQEQTSGDPPDAVIFLGPATHFDDAMVMQPSRLRFYYLEFHYPGPLFPDIIARLTRALGGTVLPFTSANDLALAIQKLLAWVGPPQSDHEPSQR